ncbi:hypothetical protein PC119_g8218 [Phytophthora cactorum]|uniref:Uncharacterized protein n=1 Tax=Phytophthora cactorum TaxID=29920 RepID=A0A8T0ZDQ8_9STRA|nr:hypothetical protein PC113_g8386 [Phytophthora cactorum]KAG3025236.1 hypothetical protein PC119_g8218 [Phytophthora cactorum]
MTEPFSFASVLNPWQETQDENVVSNHHPQQHIESSRNRRRNPDPFGKPSELLQQIGLRGKEVVKILKERDWDVCDPKALQEHKLYYVPGGRAKGELAVQGEDFFVGEGELYAYILDKGGVHFLLPDEGYSTETKMDSESDFEILDQPPPRVEPIQQHVHATDLLQDIDLHLLRSVAAIARRQVALEVASGEQNHFCCDREDSGLHEGVHQELKAERIHSPERAECAARIGISGFVPTGSGNLMLMRDMERHLLLIVAAVRQYLRTKSVSSYSGGQVSTSKRSDLRALQLNIEKMNAELTELSTIISAQAETLSQKSPTTPMELDADVETDSEQWLV